jgi:hypothetical protein
VENNTKWTDANRLAQICDKAIELIAELVYRGENPDRRKAEMRSYLTFELGMTDEEIRRVGFGSVLEENNKTGGYTDMRSLG